jgi:hypothetical protein
MARKTSPMKVRIIQSSGKKTIGYVHGFVHGPGGIITDMEILKQVHRLANNGKSFASLAKEPKPGHVKVWKTSGLGQDIPYTIVNLRGTTVERISGGKKGTAERIGMEEGLEYKDNSLRGTINRLLCEASKAT